MNKITTFLWFDDDLEDAMNFYLSVFPDSRVLSAQRNGDALFVASFELAGMQLTGLNGGPGHPFTDAISLSIDCLDQAEVDYYWHALVADGGREVACGWLADRFGLSWQVVPRRLQELLGDADAGRAGRAMAAMLKMRKIDIAELEHAADSA